MEHIDALIEQLGIGQSSANQTEVSETNEPTSNPETDLSIEPEQKVQEEKTESPEFLELKRQIEGMEKRIKDKDDYIQKLREESQAKEQSKEENIGEEEDDFWNDPVGKYKSMQQQLQIQQLQMAETIYANTVNGYWKTVNQDALREAAATDTEFAKLFYSSKEPYKTAYEYLTAKKESKSKSEQALRDEIRRELMAEMGTKATKETVPNVASMPSKSNTNSRNIDEDGFMSVFGRR